MARDLRHFVLGSPKVEDCLFFTQELFKGTIVMNWDQIQGKWKQVKGQAQQKWGDLTSDDLDVVDGKREELVGKVQERYGIAKAEAEKQVKEFETSFNG
jgi:uncharacterized protein YjbJ (UPF0337 family)